MQSIEADWEAEIRGEDLRKRELLHLPHGQDTRVEDEEKIQIKGF